MFLGKPGRETKKSKMLRTKNRQPKMRGWGSLCVVKDWAQRNNPGEKGSKVSREGRSQQTRKHLGLLSEQKQRDEPIVLETGKTLWGEVVQLSVEQRRL